jgi:hypothetical protein
MSSYVLRQLAPGDTVVSSGVSFTFQPAFPEIAATTSSEINGFWWQWLLFGRVFATTAGGTTAFDAGIMCGVHAGHLHALVLPESDGHPFLYHDTPLRSVQTKIATRKSLFGKAKLDTVALTLSPEFAVAAQIANALTPAGAVDTTDRLAEFARERSAEPG